MRLPISYSIGNVTRRPWRSIMTVLGIAIVIFASALMMSLSRGLFSRIDITGEPENMIVISRKGQNIMFSDIKEDEITHLLQMPGVARGADGEQLVSPELMHISFVGSGESRSPVSVRGVQPVAWEVHKSVRVVKGRLPEKTFEVLAGVTAHIKLGVPSLKIGDTVNFEKRDWTVCGFFDAGGGIIESELWVAEEDLKTVLRRRSHSFAVIRLQSASDTGAAQRSLDESGVLSRYFKGWTEKAYYREFTKTLSWIFLLSLFMVAAIVLAGSMIGLNTMYTSIITRLSEIGTQRVLGFSRGDILMSLIVESCILSLVGGVIGTAASLMIDDLPMKTSQGAFFLTVDLFVAGCCLVLAILIGLLGAILPSIKGLRMGIVESLRHG